MTADGTAKFCRTKPIWNDSAEGGGVYGFSIDWLRKEAPIWPHPSGAGVYSVPLLQQDGCFPSQEVLVKPPCGAECGPPCCTVWEWQAVTSVQCLVLVYLISGAAGKVTLHSNNHFSFSNNDRNDPIGRRCNHSPADSAPIIKWLFELCSILLQLEHVL